MENEWIRAELRRIRQSLQLLEGKADVSGELLPRLVAASMKQRRSARSAFFFATQKLYRNSSGANA
jgi:hypothetical protein